VFGNLLGRYHAEFWGFGWMDGAKSEPSWLIVHFHDMMLDRYPTRGDEKYSRFITHMLLHLLRIFNGSMSEGGLLHGQEQGWN